MDIYSVSRQLTIHLRVNLQTRSKKKYRRGLRLCIFVMASNLQIFSDLFTIFSFLSTILCSKIKYFLLILYIHLIISQFPCQALLQSNNVLSMVLGQQNIFYKYCLHIYSVVKFFFKICPMLQQKVNDNLHCSFSILQCSIVRFNVLNGELTKCSQRHIGKQVIHEKLMAEVIN